MYTAIKVLEKMRLPNDILLRELHNNTLLITPNNRLSQQLLKNFADKYLHTSSIAKPICLPYQNFLQYLYKELQHHNPYIEHPILLTSAQESYLWKKIAEDSNLTNTNQSFLKQIQEAWNRCRLWQIDIKHADFDKTWQGKISQDLQIKFQEYLEKHNAITQANLIDYLIKFPIVSHKKIIWACFDDYTPAQLSLQNHLQNHANEICHYDLDDIKNNSHKYTANDINDEYLTMSIWLEERLNAGDNNVAIVMPNIETHGDYLTNFLQKKLPDEHINISLGKSLTDYLLISHALLFISLENNISNCDARIILNSPYIAGSQTEFIKRAELLQNSKIFKQPNIKIQDLAQECKKIAPKLADALDGISAYPKLATPAEWVLLFQARLHDLGFPGEYGLSSEAYQCLNRLQNLFAEFVKFAIITKTMQKSAALEALYFLAKQSIFQPKQSPSKISILGLLEASGCTFDSIWITNLTDKCMPSDTNFSAFIPIEIQKNFKMPHSSNQRELKFAKQQLTRLKNSCKNIIFSYPSFIDDIPMLPSPLLLDIDPLPKINTNPILKQTKLESYTQNYLISTENLTDLPGGTSLLANQAKCPFMAFAKNRLFALPENSVDNWPNNLERGQILHKILEEFWNQVNNQQQLAALSDTEVNDLIYNLTKQVINTNKPKIDSPLHTLITDGEVKRYNNLVKEALKWELARPHFEIIATEKSYTFELNKLNFKIRIDRLDKSNLEHASNIIIDYKSRMPTSKPWDEDRPLEPQLLLYALLDDSVDCILYLELKNGHVSASGISKFALDIPGVKEVKGNDWEASKERWHKQLSSLVTEFSEGVCIPNPAKASICQTCDLQNLCRMYFGS